VDNDSEHSKGRTKACRLNFQFQSKQNSPVTKAFDALDKLTKENKILTLFKSIKDNEKDLLISAQSYCAVQSSVRVVPMSP
jgi:hypothetical protein